MGKSIWGGGDGDDVTAGDAKGEAKDEHEDIERVSGGSVERKESEECVGMERWVMLADSLIRRSFSNKSLLPLFIFKGMD